MQNTVSSETLIIDGGSNDRTVDIALRYGAKTIVLPGLNEFASRNAGAEIAKGELLFFTCADVIFPNDLLRKVAERFRKNSELVALAGPGYPFDAPMLGKIEYKIYDLARAIFAKFPTPIKRFSTSTNFLVVRKYCFQAVGGFADNDINADGRLGKKLAKQGNTTFSLHTYTYISARRLRNMGFLNFNKHYIYVLENLFFFLSGTKTLNRFKKSSKAKHRKMHVV